VYKSVVFFISSKKVGISHPPAFSARGVAGEEGLFTVGA